MVRVAQVVLVHEVVGDKTDRLVVERIVVAAAASEVVVVGHTEGCFEEQRQSAQYCSRRWDRSDLEG